MKTVFVSNYLTHHQKPFSDAMSRECEYRFIATAEMPAERIALGYRDGTEPYVLNLRNGTRAEAGQCIDRADAVLSGYTAEDLIRRRIRNGGLVFRYSERLLKKGAEPWKYPLRYCRLHRKNPAAGSVYLLCAGAYTAADYAKFGLFRDSAYKWGYFPETKRYGNVDALLDRKVRNSILWCGRFLGWKRPDDALQVAGRLKAAGYSFVMHMIGTGKAEPELKRRIRQYGLRDCVCLPGAMPPEKVREYMEAAQVFLFTSDRNEGWGAVLNESMNSGCAVVASHAIGSVPYLLKNGENGLVYKSGDIGMLFEKVRWLLDNRESARALGRRAYETIATEWNAEVAAERLLALSACILSGSKHPCLYETGPCSKAEILKDDWF